MENSYDSHDKVYRGRCSLTECFCSGYGAKPNSFQCNHCPHAARQHVIIEQKCSHHSRDREHMIVQFFCQEGGVSIAQSLSYARKLSGSISSLFSLLQHAAYVYAQCRSQDFSEGGSSITKRGRKEEVNHIDKRILSKQGEAQAP